MKLLIVPASRGIQWVKSGIKAFFKQPLALAGLFFMFLALMSILSLVPVIGGLLALTLLPGTTLGLMAGTREACNGKFPMPLILFAAFRAGREQMRSMLLLGALYAVGFVAILALSAVLDGGKFAKLYLLGGSMSAELLQDGDFQLAMLAASVFYMPLSLVFWHAPALVHWGGQGVAQALFSSTLAVWRCKGAFFTYSLAWAGVIALFGLLAALLFGVLGAPQLANVVSVPAGLTFSTVFYISLLFTFTDSFGGVAPEAPAGD